MAPLTILCLASYEKGHEFLREAKRQGCRVLLLTSLSLKEKDRWPSESIDEIFYMEDADKRWNREHALYAVSYLARTQPIDRVVPLDDFDLELAATIREHLRIPGMGETTTRYFRDKLAMRMKARDSGLNVPAFVHILNYDAIHAFTARVPPPWVLKPRMMAGAIGIKKVGNEEELWRLIDSLGDQQSFYLLERYVPGDICHADSIVYESKVLFSRASRYGAPPMDVSHSGGIFTTQLLERGSALERALLALNNEVQHAMGLIRGVAHTEFIVERNPGSPNNGALYFLETAARVGGAHIADLVEAGTGINLWAEWTKVEIAGSNGSYEAPEPRDDYAGLLVSLARQEHPDTSSFDDPEIVWRMNKEHHIGLIVKSSSHARVQELLDRYTERVRRDFHASAPPRDSPRE